MSKTHILTAKKGRPNRILPIGGKEVHVHTGSVKLIDEADVEALASYIEAKGLRNDYSLVSIPPKAVKRRRAKGTRTWPGSKGKAKRGRPAKGA